MIISQLEKRDRLAFSLVDRSCSRVTNKYIWQTVNIGSESKRNHQIRGLAAAADVILKDTSRAYHIYELSIHRLENLISLSSDQPNNAETSINKLIQVLHFTPKLRRLSFTGRRLGRPFACALASALSKETFSFQLERISTNISICDGLEDFFTKQPSIRSWKQLYDPQTAMKPLYIPNNIFPNLESVGDLPVSAILEMANGRKLQCVSTSTGLDQDVDRLIDGLVSSTSRMSLRSIHFSSDEMSAMATLLSRLPIELPELETLDVKFYNSSITAWDWDPFMFESMVEFKRLHEFRWTGDSIPETLWNPENYCNTELRRVELVLEKGKEGDVVEVFTRTSERSRWRLIELKSRARSSYFPYVQLCSYLI